MRRVSLVWTTVVGVVIVFASGVAVGQRVSPFAKLSAPTTLSQLDLMLLRAEVVEIRSHLGYDANGLSPARFFYDARSDKITAIVSVNGPALKNQSSASVRETLSKAAEGVLFDWKISVPDLSWQNFDVEFKNLHGSGPVDFAEYKNGKLTLH